MSKKNRSVSDEDLENVRGGDVIELSRGDSGSFCVLIDNLSGDKLKIVSVADGVNPYEYNNAADALGIHGSKICLIDDRVEEDQLKYYLYSWVMAAIKKKYPKNYRDFFLPPK